MNNNVPADNIMGREVDDERHVILTLTTGEEMQAPIVYRRWTESDGMRTTPLRSDIGSSCPPCCSSIRSKRFFLPYGLQYVTCLCGKHYVLRAHFHSTRTDENITEVILLPQELWVVTDETKKYNE